MVGLLVAPIPTVARAADPGGVCGEETKLARRTMERFLTAERGADVRDAVGLGSITPADLRRLDRESDAEECDRLRAWLPARYDVSDEDTDWRATCYRAGDRYLVVLISRSGDPSPDSSRIAVFAPDGRMLALLD